MAKTPISATLGRISDDDTYPLIDNNDAINTLVFKDTLAARNAIPVEMRTGCVCVVYSVKKAFKWSGSQWDEYYLPGGIIVADTDGAIPALRHSLIFDDSFAVESAGDVGAGVLIKLSDAMKQAIAKKGGSSMTINGKSIDNLVVMPPLQIDDSQSQKRLLVTPNAYEPMSPPSFLGKASSIKLVRSGEDTTIFANEPVTPYGMYFSPDNTLEGLRVQEDDDRDPNLGGQLTEVMGCVSFDDNAPADGTIKIWFMYHQNGAYIPTGYLNGVDAKPIIMERAFKTGDPLKIVISGAYWAQGQETITMHVEHSFAGEDIAIDPDGTMICVNQFENGSGTSTARIEFLRRAGVEIIPSIYKFEPRFAQMSQSMAGRTEPEQDVAAGQGEEFLSQFGINNLAACKASIDRGILTIKDNGTDILDFYVDYLVDNTRAAMMRGKQFTATVKMQNDSDAYNLALFSWNGQRNRPSKIYSSRNNGALILNTGWSEVSKQFIAENTDRNLKSYTLTATVPNDAVNLAFVLYPATAEDPVTLLIEDFVLSPVTPFTGYSEIDRYNLHEIHLIASDTYAEYGQNSEGFVSLRYTLNYAPIKGLPLPMGDNIKGNAPFTLDKTRNAVAGSQAKGGEGVRVAQKDGQVSISFDFLLWNEQGTDTVVDFWLVLYQDGAKDGSETKIPDSTMNFTVPAKSTTHGIPKTAPSIVFEIEKGQAFGLRGSANKKDGAYLESTKLTDYMVRPVIDFKELTP